MITVSISIAALERYRYKALPAKLFGSIAQVETQVEPGGIGQRRDRERRQQQQHVKQFCNCFEIVSRANAIFFNFIWAEAEDSPSANASWQLAGARTLPYPHGYTEDKRLS